MAVLVDFQPEKDMAYIVVECWLLLQSQAWLLATSLCTTIRTAVLAALALFGNLRCSSARVVMN